MSVPAGCLHDVRYASSACIRFHILSSRYEPISNYYGEAWRNPATNEVVVVSRGSNVIAVGDGDNVITTGSGFNDIHLGRGHDTVVNHWGVDTLYFADGVSAADLSFSRSGDDLLIAEGACGGTVRVVGGFVDDSSKAWGEITRFVAGGVGYSLDLGSGCSTPTVTRDRDSYDAAVDQMIQAMAASAHATSAQVGFAPREHAMLAPTLLTSH